MIPADHIEFGPFHLDILNARLWRGDRHIALRPRAFAVLHYLIEHAHQLVTKEELLLHIWPETHVSHTVLRVCILEIRRALGDRADTPTYVETVGRRGYRFLQCPRTIAETLRVMERIQKRRTIIGRQREINTLRIGLTQALNGTRQLMFVSGEAGAGKTAIIDALMTQMSTYPEVWTGRGQCMAYSGPGEAYLPVLEAIGQIGERPDGHCFIDLLRQVAPAWLPHLPALAPADADAPIPSQTPGGTQARMVRELAIALERFTAHMPLVLVFEDLHWSDPSTVDLLTFLAKRQEPAKLLVIGTYRPAELALYQHPLINTLRELHGQRRCIELAVPPLSLDHMRAYAEEALGGPVAPTVTHLLSQRTEGNALFVTHLLADLVRQSLLLRIDGTWLLQDSGQIQQTALPEGLRPLLTKQIEQLSRTEQQLLEAASVVGDTFAVAALTAVFKLAIEDVEIMCESLARQNQLIAEAGLARWPDGTISGFYRFQHTLYRQAIYERISPGRRMLLHRKIAARLEAGFQGHDMELTPYVLQDDPALTALPY